MSSVHYLNPGTSDWTERTSEDTLDLVADPFWRVRQSSQASANAIVVRCGAGYIKRSTDGGTTWSTVTPGTDPPNDAGDSPAPTASGVTYNALDASRVNVSEFVCIATWQNASSEWRSWIYFTDDDFATGTWESITGAGGTDLSSFNTAQTISGNDGATTWPAYEWSQSYLGIKGACKLTNTKVAVCYQDYASTNPVYKAYVRIVDIQANGTLLVGSEQGPFNYYANGDRNEVHGIKVFRWDDQYGLLITMEYDYEFGSGAYRTIARMFQVSGQTVTFGDALQVDTDFYPYHWDFKKLPGLNNDGIIVYSNWIVTITNRNDGYARIIRKSGVLTLSISSSAYAWTAYDNPGCSAFEVVALDDTNAVVLHDTSKDIGDGTYQLYAVPLTISGFTVTPGTRQLMGGKGSFGEIHAQKLTDTKLICAFAAGAGTVKTSVISRSGSTYTVQNTQSLSITFTWDLHLHALNESRWVLSWEDLTIGNRAYAQIGYLTGTYTHTYGTSAYIDDYPPQEYQTVCGIYLSSGMLFMYMIDDDYANEGVVGVTHTLGGPDAKALGVSIGKATGTKAWITVWTTDGLEIIDFDLSTMSESARISLGSATEAEVNNRTYIAFPVTGYGSENFVGVYGRMDNGGTPAHIIYTLDGSTFLVLESAWGATHCGSTIIWPNNAFISIRNDGSASKLYIGYIATGMAIQSIVPFEVDPHGMDIDFRDGAIAACNRFASTTMVAVCASPYITWADITSDHGTSEGVNAVAIL